MHDTWWYIWNFLLGAVIALIFIFGSLKVFMFLCNNLLNDYPTQKHKA